MWHAEETVFKVDGSLEPYDMPVLIQLLYVSVITKILIFRVIGKDRHSWNTHSRENLPQAQFPSMQQRKYSHEGNA